jgi:dTDP-4-dehydrorhamnose reductase
MRIILLGKFGQLGWELHRSLLPLGPVYAYDQPEIDLSNPVRLRPILEQHQPDLIINATAYTAVDAAESNPELAFAINHDGVGFLAEEACRLQSALIHFSTDYIFDGQKGSPYTENDQPNPLGVYGESKLAGERAIQAIGSSYMIFRTSWVYSLRSESFVTKVLKWSRNCESLRVVSDQISNPTWARVLADATAQVIAKADQNTFGWINEHQGVYHLAGSGHISRCDWAKAILKYDPKRDEQITTTLQPAQTSDFPTPASRPLYSALNCDLFSNTFGFTLPPWQEALRLALENN